MQHHIPLEPAFFVGFLACLILITAALLLFLTFAPLTIAEAAPRRPHTERRRWRPHRTDAAKDSDAKRVPSAWDDQNHCASVPR